MKKVVCVAYNLPFLLTDKYTFNKIIADMCSPCNWQLHLEVKGLGYQVSKSTETNNIIIIIITIILYYAKWQQNMRIKSQNIKRHWSTKYDTWTQLHSGA